MQYDTYWTVYSKKADFFGIAERFQIDPVIARVIRNRDIVGDEAIASYLNGDLSCAHEPSLMKDMEKGCQIMLAKLGENKRVRIISDYDVDGVSSNYILYLGLKNVWGRLHGKEPDTCDRIDYDIPHRIYDGYGMNVRMVDEAYADHVDTIITCDNGIAAFEPVSHAKALGMTVIITDHHDIPYDIGEDGSRAYRIPEADAVIDHKQPDCGYPFKELCGAGVACKFIQMLYRMCGIPEEQIEEFLEILGIATVCDVMKLTGENRIFVKAALERLKNSRIPGIRALVRNCGRDGKKLSSFDLGFIIGPCINAAGRLGSADTSLEFLLETDTVKAEERAVELLNINNQRKDMTVKGRNLVVFMLENEEKLESLKNIRETWNIPEPEPGIDRELWNKLVLSIEAHGMASLRDKVLLIYIPGIHESLVGIIAGRIKEKYYRPVMVFTDSEEKNIIKGSGRSIDGYNMYDELNRCRDYFTRFGGHEMAAGFSMERTRLKELRVKLNEQCTLDEKLMTPKLRIDVPMPLDYVTISLTRQLDLLEPFGKGNEKPVFAQSGVAVRRIQVMGKNRNVLRISFTMNNGEVMEGIYFEPDEFISQIKLWFGDNEYDRIQKGMPNQVRIDVAYYPDVNEYGGRTQLQIKLLAYKKHE